MPKDEIESFQLDMQKLGTAYLRAVLRVPVPARCEGHESFALLSTAIAACKAVGIDDARLRDIAVKLIDGGVAFIGSEPPS